MMAEEEHVNLVKMSKKRRNNNILDVFQKLIKCEEKSVVKFTVLIIKHLLETDEEKDFDYVLNRLIRGLGGTNVTVQINFFSALVALLKSLKTISIDTLIDIINKELQSSSGNSKGENADIFTGQILTCGAIVHSNLFEKLKEDEQQLIIQMLFDAGKQRSYLQIQAYTFIADALNFINVDEYQRIIHPIIKDDILKPLEEHNIESLYMCLAALDKFPILKKNLKKSLGFSKIICKDNIEIIAKILMNVSSMKAVKSPIYELVANKISNDCLESFLKQLDLCLVKPNYNRHLIFTRIVTLLLKNLTDKSLLLTENFMSQTMHVFKHKSIKDANDLLNTHLREFLKGLVQNVNDDEVSLGCKMSVLSKLLLWPGSLSFDQTTKTNTIAEITNNMKCEEVKVFVEFYKDIVLLRFKEGTSSKEKWLNSDRLYAANALTRLLRHPSITNDLEFRQDQIIFLMKIGLFKNEGISLELSTSLKKTFYSALDQKFSKLKHLRQVLMNVVYALNDCLLTKSLLLVQSMNEEIREIWDKTMEFVKKLENKKKKLSRVFLTMFLIIGLQLFQQPKMATDCLNELFLCYERVKSEKKDNAQEGDDKNNPLWIEVVVDLFLNLLSQNSYLLRNVINSVFPHLCDHLTMSAIHQILYVLDPNNNSNPLKNDQEDDGDDDDDDSNTNDEEESADETENSEEDDEAGESDLEENVTVNEKLRLAVQQVLNCKRNGLQSDEESVNLDEMNETDGIELDKALAAAFKQFKPNSGKQRTKKHLEEERALIHFRSRVLDLIKIYLNSNPSMEITIELLKPLLHLLEYTIRESQQTPFLYEPIKKCIEKMSQLKKFSSIENVDGDVLANLLNDLFDKGTRNVNLMRDMDLALTNSCLFVMRCVQFYCNVTKKSRKTLKSKINEILANELNNYMTKRDHLTPYVLWKELLSANYNEPLNPLTDVLVENAFNKNNVRLFKRTQALQLLQIVYSNNRILNSLSESDRLRLIENFSIKSVEFLKDLNQNPTDCQVNDKYLGALFHCLIIIKRSTFLFSTDKTDFVTIGKLIREIRSKLAFSANCLNQYKSLCRAIDVKHVVKLNDELINLKRGEVKDEEVNGKVNEEADESVSKNKAKRKIEDGEQSRKGKQIQRLQQLSEGLNGDFIGFSAMEVEEESDAEGTNKNKKRRKERFLENKANKKRVVK